MNSEVTLTNYSMFYPSKGQIRLLFKRNDPHNAILYEDTVLRYRLTTSDGMNKVKVYDSTGKLVVEVNRRVFLYDVFILAYRNAGKPLKVADVLTQTPSTSNSQLSMTLHTEVGIFYWHKRQAQHWELYSDVSHELVAWTETVPGSPPTWELVLDGQASSVTDYILASFFYLKAEQNCMALTEGGRAWESLDSRAASMASK